MIVRIVMNAKLIGPWCPVCISARVLWTSDYIMNHKVRRHLLTHDAWSPPPVPGGRMSGRLMMPGCHPCHVNTNTFINFLGFFSDVMWVCHATRDASCIPLDLGTPGQKKGNEGQTENIRIIEISGKIFCVRTCHVSCVTRSGDDSHCHECHEVVSSKNKNIEGAQTLFRQHTTGIWGIIKLSQKDVLFVSMRHQTIR